MIIPTAAQFKDWAINHKALAEAVCTAKADAILQKDRVAGYIRPIFESFGFVHSETGTKLAHWDYLYLCDDEQKFGEFEARADAAHREHGFTGEAGVWPDLRANTVLIEAENALLDAGCKLFDLKARPYGAHREALLYSLLELCQGTPVQLSVVKGK